MNTQVSMFFLPILCSCLISVILFPTFSSGSLMVGFYDTKCPGVETTVKNAINTAVSGNNGAAASLVRLFFHDCFVGGCDGSVLLNPTSDNPATENSPALKLRGFDLVDAAKAAVEAVCPGVVSCADILAFGARDAVRLLGGFSYPVAAGRRDGTVSSFSDALANLPFATFNLDQLKSTFARKNFSLDELITLSGAHSIGQAHCSTIQNRIYPFDQTQIDPTFAQTLQGKCPQDAPTDGVVPEDYVTPDALDVQYYTNALNNKVLLFSDYTLRTDPVAQTTMQLYSADNLLNVLWRPKFIAAMQKLGQVEVLTGTQGQIRATCGAVN